MKAKKKYCSSSQIWLIIVD